MFLVFFDFLTKKLLFMYLICDLFIDCYPVFDDLQDIELKINLVFCSVVWWRREPFFDGEKVCVRLFGEEPELCL